MGEYKALCQCSSLRGSSIWKVFISNLSLASSFICFLLHEKLHYIEHFLSVKPHMPRMIITHPLMQSCPQHIFFFPSLFSLVFFFAAVWPPTKASHQVSLDVKWREIQQNQGPVLKMVGAEGGEKKVYLLELIDSQSCANQCSGAWTADR